MKKYERRIYHSLSELWADFRAIMSQRKQIRSLMRGEGIPSSLRERLMLVVTAVNRCRYCSYAHAREALSTGISQAEIDALASGMFEDSPPEEVPALLYAQHWAEMDGEPEAPVREQVIKHYGEQVVEKMELALRMIRAGNLSGNTFDHLLQRVSFGRFGVWGQSGPE
jgi:AhpD family alkylhydroperoxidase